MAQPRQTEPGDVPAMSQQVALLRPPARFLATCHAKSHCLSPRRRILSGLPLSAGVHEHWADVGRLLRWHKI